MDKLAAGSINVRLTAQQSGDNFDLGTRLTLAAVLQAAVPASLLCVIPGNYLMADSTSLVRNANIQGLKITNPESGTERLPASASLDAVGFFGDPLGEILPRQSPAAKAQDDGTGGVVTITVSPPVGSVEYTDPINGLTQITDTLYVMKGTSVSFTAIPSPSTATFSAGEPVWGGTSGASGNGATCTVVFSSVSSSLTDYATVTATAGQSVVTVNVIVYSLTPTVSYYDTSVLNHSTTNIGVGERIDLGFTAVPAGITASDIGSMTWTNSPVKGTLQDYGDGTGMYIAGDTAYGETLTLTITSGPSTAKTATQQEGVIIPSTLTQISVDGKNYHDGSTAAAGGPYPSIGSYRYYCLSPNNVSFAAVSTREKDVTAPGASGTLSSCANIYHDSGTNEPDTDTGWFGYTYSAANGWYSEGISDQCFFIVDTLGAGSATWTIPESYMVFGGTEHTAVWTVPQVDNCTSTSTASIAKGGLTSSATLNSAYVGPYIDDGVTEW